MISRTPTSVGSPFTARPPTGQSRANGAHRAGPPPDATLAARWRAALTRRWSPGLIVTVLLILGWVAQVLWRIWLARFTTMPIAHTDEDSYLNAASAIAGGPGGFSSENTRMRRVGYPMLISPAFALERDFFTTYRIIQVLNAMLNATILPVAYLLCRQMLQLGRVAAYAAAFAAATLPAVAFYAGIAMIDVIMAPLLLGWLLLTYRWLGQRERISAAVTAGTAAGAFYLMHVRGLVIVGIHLVLAFVLWRRAMITRRALLATLAPVLGFVVLNHSVIALLGNKVRVVGTPPGLHTVEAMASGPGLVNVVAATGTQLWYLVVITFGLAGIGWAMALREVFRPTRDSAFRWTMGVALLATLGVALGSAMVLAGVTDKVADAIYARYVQMLVPLWLLIGLVAVFAATRREALRRSALAVGVLVVGGPLVALRLWYEASNGVPLRYGWFGAPDLMALTAGWDEMRPITGSLIAIGACGVLVAASRVRRLHLPMIAALVAVNLVMMNLVVDHVVRPAAALYTTTPTLAAIGVRPGERVAASTGIPYTIRFNLGHQVTWAQVPWFSTKPPASADVVLARWVPGRPDDDWDGEKLGFVRLGGNPDQQWAAWRRAP